MDNSGHSHHGYQWSRLAQTETHLRILERREIFFQKRLYEISTPSSQIFRFSKRKKKNLPVIAVIQKKVKSLSSPPQKTRATIDYKNVSLLRKCITGEGKIFPRRLTRVTAKQQRYIENAIKKARILGLLPFINISRPSRL